MKGWEYKKTNYLNSSQQKPHDNIRLGRGGKGNIQLAFPLSLHSHPLPFPIPPSHTWGLILQVTGTSQGSAEAETVTAAWSLEQ